MKYARRSSDGKIIHAKVANRLTDGDYTCPSCGEILILHQGEQIQTFVHKHQEGKYFDGCNVLSEKLYEQQESNYDDSRTTYMFLIGYKDKRGVVHDGNLFFGTQSDYSSLKLKRSGCLIDKIRV